MTGLGERQDDIVKRELVGVGLICPV